MPLPVVASCATTFVVPVLLAELLLIRLITSLTVFASPMSTYIFVPSRAVITNVVALGHCCRRSCRCPRPRPPLSAAVPVFVAAIVSVPSERYRRGKIIAAVDHGCQVGRCIVTTGDVDRRGNRIRGGVVSDAFGCAVDDLQSLCALPFRTSSRTAGSWQSG